MHVEQYFLTKGAVNLAVSPLQAQESERRSLKVFKLQRTQRPQAMNAQEMTYWNFMQRLHL